MGQTFSFDAFQIINDGRRTDAGPQTVGPHENQHVARMKRHDIPNKAGIGHGASITALGQVDCRKIQIGCITEFPICR